MEEIVVRTLSRAGAPNGDEKVDHHSHNAYNEHLSLYLRRRGEHRKSKGRRCVYDDDIVRRRRVHEVLQLKGTENAGRKRRNTNNHASAPSIETASSIIHSMDHRIHIRSRSISFLSFCCNVSSIFSLSLFYLHLFFCFFFVFSFIEIASLEFLPRVGSDLVPFALWNAPANTYCTCLH